MIYDYDADEVYFSPWLKSEFLKIFSELKQILKEHNVPLNLIPCTNDYWCRDYMPIQIDLNRYICYRYYPNYLLNDADKKYITNAEKICKRMNLDAVYSDIIIDGGNVVKAGNKIIMTEKVFEENPNIPAAELTGQLEKLFRCEILFLPWDDEEKYGHSDGIIKPISEDRILMTNYDDFDTAMYGEFKRRLSKHFKVETLQYDVTNKDKRNWAYINFLSVGNLIILPKLNIDEDEQALKQMKEYFPDFDIEQVNIEPLIEKGGGLNCISWCRKKINYINSRNRGEIASNSVSL